MVQAFGLVTEKQEDLERQKDLTDLREYNHTVAIACKLVVLMRKLSQEITEKHKHHARKTKLSMQFISNQHVVFVFVVIAKDPNLSLTGDDALSKYCSTSGFYVIAGITV